ncbi:NADP-dependent oxidoreductase [Kineosporia mesophila]|uniref:NADP-dependent oxidoreductase n=2 Tax=Kineosporia mesophila TaxID=566012 RepID=A0ABP7ALV5_9ACTN
MRVVSQDTFGDSSVLRVVDVPKPSPKPTEILVKVHAAGTNPVDYKTREGTGMAGVLGSPPFVLGWDVAGVVEEIGFGVTTFQVGDEVYGMPWFPRAAGGYGEYVTAPSRQFAPKPASISFEQAAAVPLAALTAWQAIVDTAQVLSGQRVLITAGAGGVGHLAVQIARSRGAEVISTASERNHAWLRELGATTVIDYTAVRFEDEVEDIDVVIDLAGDAQDSTSLRSLKTLRPGGLLVSVPGGVSPGLAEAALRQGVRATGILVEPDGEALRRIGALIDDGSIHVEVEQVLPLEDAAKAHDAAESGHTRGKIVLSLV